jgi:hypothetical protein
MLSGRHPYGQIRPNDLEKAIVDGERMAPMPDTVPLDLQAVVEKMLAHRVESRYTDTALAADFDNYLNGRPTEAGTAKRRTGATTIPVPPGRLLHRSDESPADDAPPDPSAVPQSPGAGAGGGRVLSNVGRVARVAAVVVIIGFLVSEGAVWIRAEGLARRIPTMDSADVAVARSQYADIRKWAVFGLGLEWRVNGPLRDRMLAVAEQPIAEYRADSVTVREVRWRQAAVCIALAGDLSPGNARVESARKVIEGHLQRIRATTPAEFQTAIRTFQAAAALDPASVDPYLGLARIHAYNVKDVDALTADIKNAELRGYKSGRRERAELDDAMRVRAAVPKRTAGLAPIR